MILSDFELGTKVLVYTRLNTYNTSKIMVSREETNREMVEATIVGKQNNSDILLGWTTLPIVAVNGNYTLVNDGYVYADNIQLFKYYYWVAGDYCCRLPINHPNQKCMICNRAAPHQEPNMINNMYMCSTCRFIKELQ